MSIRWVSTINSGGGGLLVSYSNWVSAMEVPRVLPVDLNRLIMDEVSVLHEHEIITWGTSSWEAKGGGVLY